MKSKVKRKLEILRENYKRETGQFFNYFWCPILNVDEDAELIEAHITNRSFPNSGNFPRVWTVQRKDVDNFYGAFFEADFVALKFKDQPATGDLFVDKDAFTKLNPKLYISGQAVDYFVLQGDLPPNTSRLHIEGTKGSIDLGLKLPPEEFRQALNGGVQIGYTKDMRLSALVSLIKAAHLTLFELLGYSYALSTAGRFVGHDILGRFYIDNCKLQRDGIIEKAKLFFADYIHMVRPAIEVGLEIQGSINDRTLWMCRRYDGMPWAWIVFIRLDHLLHAVIIPISHNPDAIYTFLNFLKNDQELIEASLCEFTGDAFNVSPQTFQLNWIKQVDFAFE